MSSRATKRIVKDISDLVNNIEELNKNNIYFYINDENIFEIYFLLIGTVNTPYNGGFYFFKFNFCNEYPIKPPTVKFISTSGNIRFNPNLYTCGKVCLSIINTWQGPRWTPTQTITSVLFSLQAMVLNEMPLTNEPGFENHPIIELNKYNSIILHENYRVNVNKILNNQPPPFQNFKNIMNRSFINNFNQFYEHINQLILDESSDEIKSPAYGMSIKTNYRKILEDLKNNFNNLLNFYIKKKIKDFDDKNLINESIKSLITIIEKDIEIDNELYIKLYSKSKQEKNNEISTTIVENLKLI